MKGLEPSTFGTTIQNPYLAGMLKSPVFSCFPGYRNATLGASVYVNTQDFSIPQ
jgi:hypothetical protein